MFGIYRKKINFLFMFSVKGKKLNIIPSHFSIILLSAGWVHLQNDYNIILMND